MLLGVLRVAVALAGGGGPPELPELVVRCPSRLLVGVRIPGPMRRLILTTGLSLLAACSAGDLDGSVQVEPLEARAETDGTMFERVDPQLSGLVFENTLLPEHSYPYLNNGAGVAIGDVDGDGRPDAYLVSRDGPNRLFRQTASFRFEDVTERAGVDGGQAWGAGATFVDIEGDGDLDLYVCNTEAPNLLYVNDGHGVFEERAREFGLDLVAASEMAAFADYDRDGDVDLYLLTNRVFSGSLPREILADVRPPADTAKTVEQMAPRIPDMHKVEGRWQIPAAYRDFVTEVAGRLYFGGQRDLLMRNDDGKFSDVSEKSGIADQGMGLSATWWDYDGDGWPDLFVANDLESPDQLYHNNGDGTFTDATSSALPRLAYFGMGSDAADVNNDGRLDLIVGDMSNTTHFKSKWVMGDMTKRRHVLENTRPQQQMRNALFLNTGTERFLEVAAMTGVASTDWTWAVKFGDLDNDGWVDLFATNGIPRFDMNPDMVEQLRGTPRPIQVAVARRIPPLPEANLALRNTGGLSFDSVGVAWGLADSGVSQGAAFSDLDRDGDLDLIVNNLGAAWLYRNRGGSGSSVLIALHGVRSNRSGLGARVTIETAAGRQVRELTLARGFLSSDEPVLHFGLGDVTAIDSLRVQWPSGIVQELHDLAVDHSYTITEPDRDPVEPPARAPMTRWFSDATTATGLIFEHHETPHDDYATQPLLPHKLSHLGPGLAWGDFDDDGDDDLFVGGAAGQPGVLYEDTGNGTYRPTRDGPWSRDRDAEDMAALWFDVDSDADLDLYVVSGSVEFDAGDARYADRLYLNRGEGLFTRASTDVLPDIRDSGSVVAAADYDRDGDVDLFVGGRVVPGRFPHAPPSRLLRNDGGRLVDVTEEITPGLREVGMVTAALWSDADDDGWLDLIVAAHWQPVVLFRNLGKDRGLAAPIPLGSQRGWWNGLCAADLDADGDLDYVATNFGLNTKYHADPDHPASLYAADFNGDGVLDVVEAEYERDVLFPVRGRSCSSATMPFIAEKFPSYQQFAQADLPSIYGAAELEDALHLQVNELRSGVFKNLGNRSFAFEPLPRIAQVAPAFGVVSADFNGDGWLDVYLTHNFYPPEPETGRMAGGIGLLLRGTGGGALEPVPATESGLIVPQDARAVAICEVSGDVRPDLVITSNHGPLRVYRNGLRAANYLLVRLRGRPGNPRAAGARFTLVTEGGHRQVIERHAGSGYLAQSSIHVFFGLGDRAPTELQVTWPDGGTARIPLAAGDASVTITW